MANCKVAGRSFLQTRQNCQSVQRTRGCPRSGLFCSVLSTWSGREREKERDLEKERSFAFLERSQRRLETLTLTLSCPGRRLIDAIKIYCGEWKDDTSGVIYWLVHSLKSWVSKGAEIQFGGFACINNFDGLIISAYTTYTSEDCDYNCQIVWSRSTFTHFFPS